MIIAFKQNQGKNNPVSFRESKYGLFNGIGRKGKIHMIGTFFCGLFQLSHLVDGDLFLLQFPAAA